MKASERERERERGDFLFYISFVQCNAVLGTDGKAQKRPSKLIVRYLEIKEN